MLLSETRACSEVRSARWKYHSTGVVRNSLTARAASAGSGTGSMKPLCVSTSMVTRPDRQPGGDRRERPAGVLQRPGRR